MCLRWTVWFASAGVALLAPSEHAEAQLQQREKLRQLEQMLSELHGKARMWEGSESDPSMASGGDSLQSTIKSVQKEFDDLKWQIAAYEDTHAERTPTEVYPQDWQESEEEDPTAENEPPEVYPVKEAPEPLPDDPEVDRPHDVEAQEPDHLTESKAKDIHRRMDGNDDGKVSLTEVMDFSQIVGKSIAKRTASDTFPHLDSNGDMRIDLGEITQILATGGEEDGDEVRAMRAKKFKIADENGDGALDHGELPSFLSPETHDHVFELHAAAVFKKKDIDRDGMLAHDEFWYLDGTEDELTMHKLHTDFRHLDLDQSGKLDLREMKRWESGAFHVAEAMRQLFEVADRDGDEYITLSELQRARDAMAGSPTENHLVRWAEHHEL